MASHAPSKDRDPPQPASAPSVQRAPPPVDASDDRPKHQASLVDGLKTIRLSDFTEVHKTPCARESFLTGMGAGFGVGGIRLVFGGSPWASMSYAVFSFSLVSASAHAFCQRRRQLEQASMARAAEIMAKKKEERALRAAETRAERERRREEHERQKSGWGRMTGWWAGGSRGKDVANDQQRKDREGT